MAFKLSGNVSQYSVEDLAQYLLDREVRTGLVVNFRKNLVNGAAFLQLTEEDLKELVPLVGERVLIRQLLKQSKLISHSVSVNYVSPFPPTSFGLLQGKEKINSTLVSLRAPVSSHPVSSQPSCSHPSSPVPPTASTSGSTSASSGYWHLSFEIPDKHTFCGAIQNAIDTGSVCARARRGIIQILRTLVTQHTKYPSSMEYNVVCRKLIGKYPKLHDGRNEGFDSWKVCLRNSFKNFRRDRSSNDIQLSSKHSGTPIEEEAKRQKFYDPYVDFTDEEYEGMVRELQEEHKKKKKLRNQAAILQLMERTRGKRRRWIAEKNPLLVEILNKFPLLDTSEVLRREFKYIARCDNKSPILLNNWSQWAPKIVAFCRTEPDLPPAMSTLIREYDTVDTNGIHNPTDRSDFIVLNILLLLLYQRDAKGHDFIKRFEACDVDITYDAACDVDITYDAEKVCNSVPIPYIVFTGNPGCDNSQFFVSYDRIFICECQSLQDAFIDLIATYQVFNVTYPQALAGILLFFQHIIFEMRDKQPYPVILFKFVNKIQKLTDGQ